MLPASFFAIAAIALSPILESMGAIGPGASALGTFGGIAYLMLRCGMILDIRLSSLEGQPTARAGRVAKRATGRALVTR